MKYEYRFEDSTVWTNKKMNAYELMLAEEENGKLIEVIRRW